jgi:hypothetical protein
VGDKSPKAKDRAKKQDARNKEQKKSSAQAKTDAMKTQKREPAAT